MKASEEEVVGMMLCAKGGEKIQGHDLMIACHCHEHFPCGTWLRPRASSQVSIVGTLICTGMLDQSEEPGADRCLFKTVSLPPRKAPAPLAVDAPSSRSKSPARHYFPSQTSFLSANPDDRRSFEEHVGTTYSPWEIRFLADREP